ncbi:hypothetical protein [Paenibacillus chungangensis]|uniref:Uncharacterized protein n=1 Tax=Paenibacillus chungangensis TaxID=696535 RepID=A0ABW3HQ97_9BACL
MFIQNRKELVRIRKNRSLFSVSLLALLVAILIAGCASSNKPSKEQTSTNQLDQVVVNIHSDGNYVFEDQAWMTSKEDVMKAKGFNQADVNGKDRLIAKGEFPLDESFNQLVIYNFEDDQLVSGEYLFSVADKERFTALSKELKILLSSSLEAPISNDLSLLDEAASAAQEGKHVMWEGKDKSNLRLNVLTTTNVGKMEYLLQIQSNSPRPAKKTLHS